jgi:hypothetical protein
MTVLMKIDLVGPKRRGLALGLNEAAGYGGVALAAGLSGWLAAEFAARDVLVAGAAIAVVAFLVSVLFVRDTAAHVALEQAHQHPHADDAPPPLREAFAQATYRVPALRSCAQAGLVNNLNDGLAWGLVPLFLAAHGASVGSIGLVAAVYPGVWSVAQIATGHWSDSIGRKPLIVAGMLTDRGRVVRRDTSWRWRLDLTQRREDRADLAVLDPPPVGRIPPDDDGGRGADRGAAGARARGRDHASLKTATLRVGGFEPSVDRSPALTDPSSRHRSWKHRRRGRRLGRCSGFGSWAA